MADPINIADPGASGPALTAALKPLVNLGVTAESDIAPTAAAVHGGNAYSQAAINTGGADLILSPGIGQRYFGVVDYTLLAGKTITIGTNVYAQFYGVIVTLTEGVEWNAETSNDVTAANLATAIGIAVGVGATAAAVGAVVYLTPSESTNKLDISTDDDGSGLAAVQDDDGVIWVPGFILMPVNPNPTGSLPRQVFFRDGFGTGGEFLNDLGTVNNSEFIHTPGVANPDIHITFIETGGTAGDEILTLNPGEEQYALKAFKIIDIYSQVNPADVVVVDVTYIKNVDGTDLTSIRMPTDHGKLALVAYGTSESVANIWRVAWASPTVEIVPDWRFRFSEEFPTADPEVVGQFWLNSGVLTRSSGPP